MQHKNDSVEINFHHLWQERKKNPSSKSTSIHSNYKSSPLISPQPKKKKFKSNTELELADVHFHTIDNTEKSNNKYDESNESKWESDFSTYISEDSSDSDLLFHEKPMWNN